MRKDEVGLARRGTSVVVHNLFGDVPVRSKQLSSRYTSGTETERAFDRMKLIFVGYLLALPRAVDLRFSLNGGKKLSLHYSSSCLNTHRFSLKSTASILAQANLLSSVSTTNWHSASVRTSQFSIRAAISTEPFPSKTAQFISIGQFPVRRGHGTSHLWDTIDRLFDASSFGEADESFDTAGDAIKGRKIKKTQVTKMAKGVNRWPMFYIRVDAKSKEFSQAFVQLESAPEDRLVLDHLTKAMETLIAHFLVECDFKTVPRSARCREAQGPSKYEQGFGEPTSVQQSTSDLSRLATEARYLNHWRRVKSAKCFDENLRYGLGFGKQANALQTVSDKYLPKAAGHPSLSTEHHAAEDDLQLEEEEDEIAAEIGIPWTNPRNGQTVRLHSGTGAVIPTTRQFTVRDDCCRYSNGPQKEDEGLNNTACAKPTTVGHNLGRPAHDLQKYLRSPFSRPEAPIACIIPDELFAKEADHEVRKTAVQVSRNLSKASLASAIVIRQADRKFILATVPGQSGPGGKSRREGILVLIDQHAADERIKYEQLCHELCERQSTNLARPLIFEVDDTEAKLFKDRKEYFKRWCLDYRIANCQTTHRTSRAWKIELLSLPALIAERCRAEPKLLIDLMRHEIWSGGACNYGPLSEGTRSWWCEIASCPAGLVEMLKSRSCRTAIMFNDLLDTDQCREVILKLSRCIFPFQCAHGRPTVTVLANTADIDLCAPLISPGMTSNHTDLGYGDAWTNWMATR